MPPVHGRTQLYEQRLEFPQCLETFPELGRAFSARRRDRLRGRRRKSSALILQQRRRVNVSCHDPPRRQQEAKRDAKLPANLHIHSCNRGLRLPLPTLSYRSPKYTQVKKVTVRFFPETAACSYHGIGASLGVLITSLSHNLSSNSSGALRFWSGNTERG